MQVIVSNYDCSISKKLSYVSGRPNAVLVLIVITFLYIFCLLKLFNENVAIGPNTELSLFFFGNLPFLIVFYIYLLNY